MRYTLSVDMALLELITEVHFHPSLANVAYTATRDWGCILNTFIAISTNTNYCNNVMVFPMTNIHIHVIILEFLVAFEFSFPIPKGTFSYCTSNHFAIFISAIAY